MSAQIQFLVRSQCGGTCLASKIGHGGRGKPAPNLVHFHETCFRTSLDDSAEYHWIMFAQCPYIHRPGEEGKGGSTGCIQR